MSSNNRITDNVATVAGPPPSTNGRPAPSTNGRPSFSPGSQNRGGQHPTPPPSANGAGEPASANGHDDHGHFAKGNPGGPGNPFARLVAELRKSAMAAIGQDGLTAIFRKMHQLALEGNVAAAKFCTSYMIGKPLPPKDPDRVDVEEWQLMKEEAPILKEVGQQGPILDPHVPLAMARNRRYGATMDRGGMISALFSMPTKEQFRLFEMNAASPHELCNLLRAKARHPDKPPSANGKRKKHRK